MRVNELQDAETLELCEIESFSGLGSRSADDARLNIANHSWKICTCAGFPSTPAALGLVPSWESSYKCADMHMWTNTHAFMHPLIIKKKEDKSQELWGKRGKKEIPIWIHQAGVGTVISVLRDISPQEGGKSIKKRKVTRKKPWSQFTLQNHIISVWHSYRTSTQRDVVSLTGWLVVCFSANVSYPTFKSLKSVIYQMLRKRSKSIPKN